MYFVKECVSCWRFGATCIVMDIIRELLSKIYYHKLQSLQAHSEAVSEMRWMGGERREGVKEEEGGGEEGEVRGERR